MFNQSKLFVYHISVVVNVSLNNLYSKKKNDAQGFLFVVLNKNFYWIRTKYSSEGYNSMVREK
jgi:hypothetical protein